MGIDKPFSDGYFAAPDSTWRDRANTPIVLVARLTRRPHVRARLHCSQIHNCDFGFSPLINATECLESAP